MSRVSERVQQKDQWVYGAVAAAYRGKGGRRCRDFVHYQIKRCLLGAQMDAIDGGGELVGRSCGGATFARFLPHPPSSNPSWPTPTAGCRPSCRPRVSLRNGKPPRKTERKQFTMVHLGDVVCVKRNLKGIE